MKVVLLGLLQTISKIFSELNLRVCPYIESIKLLLKEVCGKDITELIAAGGEKLASVPCGCGMAVAAAEKKEAKKEEKEESDDDMGFSLFESRFDSSGSGFCSLL